MQKHETCRTNLQRIYEKLLKLSCPQVNVNADGDTAELQLQQPNFLNKKIKRWANKR